MFCQKCGASNDDALKFCVSCGNPLVPVQTEPGEPTTVLNEAQTQTPPPAAVPPYQPAQPTYAPPPASVPPYQPPVQTAYAPPAPPQKKKGHAGLIIAIVALLLIGVVAAVLLITKPWVKDENETTAPGTTASQTTQQDTSAPPETTNAGETTQEGSTNEETSFYWGEGTEWPSGGLFDKLPKPNFGKVTFTGTDEADGTATVMLSEVTKANFDSYLDALRSAGFTKNVYSGNMFGVFTYTASNPSGEEASANFVESMGTLTIVLDTTP
ncbi:MAG TPA: hypothetical protein PL044_10570 [Clostridiales bacterium]|nr:MAG: hypothetical protein BWY37_01021 [Firmicutes bacterium ADurb.Bin262]HOU10296.1 hypothetical protein [Clostridiales bacterium]HQK74196.1 hypothetical protein [Clostridiales bacterium]